MLTKGCQHRSEPIQLLSHPSYLVLEPWSDVQGDPFGGKRITRVRPVRFPRPRQIHPFGGEHRREDVLVSAVCGGAQHALAERLHGRRQDRLAPARLGHSERLEHSREIPLLITRQTAQNLDEPGLLGDRRRPDERISEDAHGRLDERVLVDEVSLEHVELKRVGGDVACEPMGDHARPSRFALSPQPLGKPRVGGSGGVGREALGRHSEVHVELSPLPVVARSMLRIQAVPRFPLRSLSVELKMS